VLSRMLHGHRFARRPFHVDRPWRQSLRSRIVAADSGTRLFQFALWAMLQYALRRRSLAGLGQGHSLANHCGQLPDWDLALLPEEAQQVINVMS